MTRHSQVTDEIRHQAALHALGMLEGQQARAFREHLDDGCEVCTGELRAFQQTAACLPLALPESRPDAGVRARLMSRIREPEPVVVRAGRAGWQESGIEGVTVKSLYADPTSDQVTMLVRMTAGAIYPRHRHAAAEQCLVLEGDLHIGDLALQAGDYTCAAPETTHPVVSTVGGCLLMIIASRRDEVLI